MIRVPDSTTSDASPTTTQRRRHRTLATTGADLRLLLLLTLVLTGCATSTSHADVSPVTNAQSGSTRLRASPAPTQASSQSVDVSTCCAASIPASWSTPKLIANGLFGASDPTTRLAATWQVIGPAHACPLEPPATLDSLVSPAQPSGDVITTVDSIMVSGKHVTVYVTAPSIGTPRGYQYLNADVVLGANCVDLGGAEYGVANAFNLQTLLKILATTRPTTHSLQP